MGVIYKRNGKTEVERGVNTREKRGDTNILIKTKESKRFTGVIWCCGSYKSRFKHDQH